MTGAIIAAVVPIAVTALRWIGDRPQRGILLLAALLPFDGLLDLVDHPRFLDGWKEGIVLAAFIAALAAPASARPASQPRVPSWAVPLALMVALASGGGLFLSAATLPAGLKIGFFYLIAAITLWMCPLNAAERDRFVTIVMVVLGATAVVALAQQIVGAETLVDLGYEYNRQVRFSGERLRSFATLSDPFSYALFSMFGLLVTLPVALRDAARLRNLVFIAATPLMVLGLLTSVVRASIIGFAVGAAYLLARREPRLLAAAAAGLVVVLLVAPAGDRSTYLSTTSLIERTEGWADAIGDEVTVTPLGNGLGTTGSAAEAATGSDLRVGAGDELAPADGPYQPDNYYLKVLIELGPVGLWLFAGFLLAAFASARRVARRASGTDAALASGIAAAMLGAGVAALASTYWEVFPADAYFWITLGVLLSIDSRSTPLPSAPEAAASKPTYESSSVN